MFQQQHLLHIKFTWSQVIHISLAMDVYDINNASSTSSSSIGYPSNMVEEQHHGDDDDVDDGEGEGASSCVVTNDNMFELSDLMSQLPIKKGLSKYYNGKSNSFKNLSTLKSLEDVPKNMSHRIKKKKNMKQDNNNNNNKYSFTITPKSKISKTHNNKNRGSMKGSILMNTWKVTSTSGFNNPSTSRFIHV